MTRWKLVSVVLAACLSYSWLPGDAESEPASGATQLKRDGRVRMSPAALGMSREELVRRLFAAKTVEDVRDLAEKLGMIGNDDTIAAIMPLLADQRAGVPEAILDALGTIASERAVDVLIEHARDPRAVVRIAAVDAIARTRSRRAESVLVELAGTHGDPAQASAVTALGALDTDAGVEVLARLAHQPDELGATAIRALGAMERETARGALLQLIDSPSVRIASLAIDELRTFDAELIAKLTALADSGQRELVSSALSALGRAGEPGIPALREAALQGALELRISAINILATVDSPQRFEVLRAIIESEEGRIVDAVVLAIAGIDNDEARELLISAALADDAGGTRAVEMLVRQSGPDVEQALLVIAKSESSQRWTALEHLVRLGHADATQLAIAQARGGSFDERSGAMAALAGAATPQAIDTLVAVAREGGDHATRALELVGTARPDDPRVTLLLRDALHSKDAAAAALAASMLGKVGTEQARDMLIAALASSEVGVASNAATALGKFRLTDEMAHALRSAASAHPALRTEVMTQLIAAGSPAGLELARAAFEDPERSHDAFRAISVLEQAGTRAAVDMLATATRARDPQVRAEAVASIGSTGDKRATELVAAALRDSDATVRSAALRTLGQLGNDKARELLIQATHGADYEDRYAAVQSLRRYEHGDATRRLTELSRDNAVSIAYAAIDSLADRPEGLSVLRGIMLDTNVTVERRTHAARSLSYRGISDPAIDALLAFQE